jgi:hypothetical protein
MSRDGILAEWLRWVILIASGSLDRAEGMHFNRGVVQRLPGSKSRSTGRINRDRGRRALHRAPDEYSAPTRSQCCAGISGLDRGDSPSSRPTREPASRKSPRTPPPRRGRTSRRMGRTARLARVAGGEE